MNTETINRFCAVCGATIETNYRFCMKCGRKLTAKNEETHIEKENIKAQTAFWVSSVFPGFGHLYLKMFWKGLFFILSALIILSAIFMPIYIIYSETIYSIKLIILDVFLVIAFGLFHLFVMTKAYRDGLKQDCPLIFTQKKIKFPTFLPVIVLFELVIIVILNFYIIVTS